jgi:hypothetical protein
MQQGVSAGLRGWAGALWIGVCSILFMATAHGATPDAPTPLLQPSQLMPGRLDALAERLRAAPQRQGRPYAIVDKPTATLIVYRADGRRAGVTPVLLGRALGDDTLPGTGERTAAGRLQERDRTTPAGGFVSEPGRNLDGEAIVWLDYDNALAIHRLRPGEAQEARLQRLASPHVMQRRVSAGCVVVPVGFYEAVVEPLLGRSRGWVVITREDGSWQEPAAPSFASAY